MLQVNCYQEKHVRSWNSFLLRENYVNESDPPRNLLPYSESIRCKTWPIVTFQLVSSRASRSALVFFLWAFISALRYLPLLWLAIKLCLLRYRIYDNQSQNALIVSRGSDRPWLQEDSCVREICLLPSYWHSRACQVVFWLWIIKFCSQTRISHASYETLS